MQALSARLVENLAAIHAVDYETAGLGELGRPEGYVRRQIEGWTRRYRKAQTGDVPQVEEVAAWLASHMPPESGAALIHNDYKYDNLVLNPERPTEIVAVLDWEMATIGDPLMDVGTSLGYWVEAGDPPLLQALAFGPTALPGNYDRKAFFDRYLELSGREGGDPVFYFVYGLFKIIGIVQQIYYRYRQGFTQDPRFAMLDQVVVLLAQQAIRAIERERIDRLD
jgi:aminoglycoside phosphotransferase (APT) family kinase protein